MKSKDKRKLLVELIELYIFCGYDITGLVGYPLSAFDTDALLDGIEKMKIEKDVINGETDNSDL